MIKNFFNILFLFFLLSIPLKAHSTEFKVKLIKIIKKNDIGKHLSMPTAINYNPIDNLIYVIDAPRERIILYNFDFFPFYSIGKGRNIYSPVSIAINKDDYIYICQAKKPGEFSKISIFSPSFIKKKEIILNNFTNSNNFYPKSISIGKNNKIYLVGNGVNGVVILNNKGNYIKTLKIKDSLNNDKKSIHDVSFSDIYIDSNYRIYILSEELGKGYILSPNEKLLFKAGTKGGTPGKLSRPRAIAADPQKKLIYILDYMRQIVQIFNYETGKFLYEFGGYGSNPGLFNYPTDLTIDNYGRIYITDLFNKRIQVFEIIKK